MKLQTISLIFIIVIYQIAGQLHKLTPEENEERLNTCGKEFLPRPSDNLHGKNIDFDKNGRWLVKVGRVNETPGSFFAGFQISQRYVFTTSEVVLTGEGKWRVDSKWFNRSQCIDGKHYIIPEKAFNHIVVVSPGGNISRVTGGITFELCDAEDFDLKFSPMLLEIEHNQNLPKSVPCVADESTNWEVGNEVDVYGLNEGKTIMEHHKLKILNLVDGGDLYKKSLYVSYYNLRNDRGGPVVLNYTGRATVLGCKDTVSAAERNKGDGDYYANLRYLQKEICNFSGVCQILPTTPAPTTTTLDPPTTSEVTIPDPLNTQNPEKKPESPAPKPSGKTTKKPIKQKWKKTFEYVNEEDQKDSRLTMFVGDGEWNGAGTMNFLLVLMMVLRV